jgi:hypothetical protein
MSWIRDVIEAHSESEAPERFFYWSALSAMSAAIKKNIWMNRGGIYKLYPNIYVFLVAKSGMKKGIPVSLAKNLVEKSGVTKVISGRNSVPRVIYDLGKMKTSPGVALDKKAQAFIVSGELASFLVKDIDGLKILTELYNTHENEEKWENSLKGTGVDTLIEPCLTLFGATNDDHFVETIPKSDIKGGFIARTFIVSSDERGILNSLVNDSKKMVDLNKLSEFLKELNKLKGEFKWTKETGDFYDSWYYPFMADPPDDSTGTYNRIGDSILKVAMLLSLSKNLKLEMDLDSLQEAKAECLNCARAANQISMGGTSNLSTQTRIIMRALLSHPDHKLSRTQILRKYWGDVNHYDLDLVIETLLGAGIIDVQNYGKERFYKMKEIVVKEYLEFERKTRQ